MEGLRKDAEGLDPEEDGGPPQLDPSDDETEQDRKGCNVGWTMRRGRWARPDNDDSLRPRPQSAEVQDPSRPPVTAVVQSTAERAESGSESESGVERPWTEIERGKKKKMWKKKAETRQSLEKLQKG